MVGYPSNGTLMYVVVTNGVKNNPFTKQDVNMVVDMLGKSQYSYQCEEVRRQPLAVEMNIIPVPPTFIDHYKDV